MSTDAELLGSYAREGAEQAFTELVRRHIDLVYSAALREAQGDPSRAEDVAQAVFTELARQASKLGRHPALAGWLYTCVRRVSANLRRGDNRRQRREREAQTMNEILSQDPPETGWRQVQPVIDDAMHELSEKDRAAIVLRFFEEQSFKEIGLALGLHENAARMRVERALEKLRALLARRGIVSTASGLAAALAAGAVLTAPAGLAAGVAAGALAAAGSAAATTTLTAVKLMTLTHLKVAALGALVVAGAATPLVVQQQQARTALVEGSRALERRLDGLARENTRLSNLVARAAEARALPPEQLSELMKLRGEVGLLRKQVNDLEKLRSADRRGPAAGAGPGQGSDTGKAYTAEDYNREQGIAKLNYTKNWVLAFMLYAEKNRGQFPATLDQALAYLPDEAKIEMNLAPEEFLPNTPKFGLTPDRFELVYSGALADLTNPASVIVLREKEAWGEEGRWNRAYGFADGHSEIHHSADGHYEAWEKQHSAVPAGQP